MAKKVFGRTWLGDRSELWRIWGPSEGRVTTQLLRSQDGCPRRGERGVGVAGGYRRRLARPICIKIVQGWRFSGFPNFGVNTRETKGVSNEI
jgi:hypothetical protein